MNALVAVRNNRAGQLSPTPEVRAQVVKQLATTAAARQGLVARELLSSSSAPAAAAAITSPAKAVSSAVETQTAQTVGASSSTDRVVTGDTLGKDAFLQLLVLQMQNQDPLEPMDNADMLAQLAQFSALEATTNLNTNFEQLSGNIDQLNFISASQMLGKYVEGVDINGDLKTGIVEGVHLDGSLVVLKVDGNFMTMAGVIRVENTDPGNDGGSGGDGGSGEDDPVLPEEPETPEPEPLP